MSHLSVLRHVSFSLPLGHSSNERLVDDCWHRLQSKQIAEHSDRVGITESVLVKGDGGFNLFRRQLSKWGRRPVWWSGQIALYHRLVEAGDWVHLSGLDQHIRYPVCL